jgi:glycerophosphoryl diester phosphodiesterase
MSLKKTALLLISGVGLFSVANFSAEIGTVRDKKRVFQGKPFWVIAHRGYSGRFPENTLLAFDEAAKLPIDAIELDVHSSRDGRIVVIHDPTLDRTTDRNGRVFDQNWDFLKKMDAGYMCDPEGHGEFPFRSKGIGIPLLEDVFKHLPNMKFIIEIKQTLPAIEEPIYRLIRKYRMEEKVIVASEHIEPLIRFRGLAPLVATNLSSIEAREFYRSYRMKLSNFYRSKGDALQIPPDYHGNRVVTYNFVQAAKRKGLILHVWTVNDPGEMKELMDAGVDGIITDFPDHLLKVAAVRQS